MRSGATLLLLVEARRRGRFRFEVELIRIGSRRVEDMDDIWPCGVVRGVAWVVTRDRMNVAHTRGSKRIGQDTRGSKRLGQAAGGR